MIFLELLPFFIFYTAIFKCDISESIIARGLKLLSTCRVQLVDYLVKIKKNHIETVRSTDINRFANYKLGSLWYE